MKGSKMSIKVTYIHNKQAVPVKGADWKIAARNQQFFDYRNAVLNGKQLFSASPEMQEAFYGNY
jgi:hypothetical protein